MPLPTTSPLDPGTAGPVILYPNIVGPAAMNPLAPLPLDPITGLPVPQAPAMAGPLLAGADIAAIGLNAVGVLGGPDALGASYPAGMDPWVAAMSNARLGASTMANSNIIASKAEQMRSLFLVKAGEIYQRLITIRFSIAPLQANANAAVVARAALLELINEVNRQGFIEPNQAQALNDLATELNALDIPNLINALVGEINELSRIVRLPNNVAPNPIPINPPDVFDAPIRGGSKNSRKKGGYKFTKAAKKRRSLRMSKRKSLSRMHKKTKRKRKRKTKKHH